MVLKYKISSVLTEYLIHVHNDNFYPTSWCGTSVNNLLSVDGQWEACNNDHC